MALRRKLKRTRQQLIQEVTVATIRAKYGRLGLSGRKRKTEEMMNKTAVTKVKRAKVCHLDCAYYQLIDHYNESCYKGFLLQSIHSYLFSLIVIMLQGGHMQHLLFVWQAKGIVVGPLVLKSRTVLGRRILAQSWCVPLNYWLFIYGLCLIFH